MPESIEFEFFDPGPLVDRELLAKVVGRNPANPSKGWVPSYDIELWVDQAAEAIGKINFRAGNTPSLQLYGGHFAYSVLPQWRGHHYGERGVRLLLPLAKRHGLSVVWITCNPDNWPSRRTCERLGAQLVEVVPLPPDNDMYLDGEREKCRYRLTI